MDQLVLQIGPFPIPLSVKSERWGVDGGMTAGWQGQRNSVRASFMRRVTDGGGLTGAVHSNLGKLELRRQLSERWTGNAEVTYAANDALSLAYGDSFRTLRAIGGLNYDLSKDLSIALNYSHDHQKRRAVADSPTSGITDYDRIWFSVSYHFTRPLGW
jgi:hypothetical protein